MAVILLSNDFFSYGAVAVANNAVIPFKSDTRLSNYTAPVSGANAGKGKNQLKLRFNMSFTSFEVFIHFFAKFDTLTLDLKMKTSTL